MADPDASKVRHDSATRLKQWMTHGVTLLLFSILIVAGVGAYLARQQFWALYLSLTR